MSEMSFCGKRIDLTGGCPSHKELAAAKDELKTGNQLYARLTDRKNGLENELAAAKAEIDDLHGHLRLRGNLIMNVESETKRLREALETISLAAEDREPDLGEHNFWRDLAVTNGRLARAALYGGNA